jgi:hypothetical protein
MSLDVVLTFIETSLSLSLLFFFSFDFRPLQDLLTKVPFAVTWSGVRRFVKEVLPRYTPKIVERVRNF